VLSSKSESLVQLFRIFNNENYNSDGCRVRLEPSFLLDREANKIVKGYFPPSEEKQYVEAL
jgi:hypothetical protein